MSDEIDFYEIGDGFTPLKLFFSEQQPLNTNSQAFYLIDEFF